jgi:ribonucleases P/MRP protein subunit RPP40
MRKDFDCWRLTTLVKRRARGDLIETFKILSGRELISKELFFQPAPAHYGLRGHSMKIYKPCCRTVLRKSFFSLRVIDDWNSLPQSVVSASSVNEFKNRLDKFWHNDISI